MNLFDFDICIKILNKVKFKKIYEYFLFGQTRHLIVIKEPLKNFKKFNIKYGNINSDIEVFTYKLKSEVFEISKKFFFFKYIKLNNNY